MSKDTCDMLNVQIKSETEKPETNRNMEKLRAEQVSKGAKIRNRYNQVPHLTQDTNGKATNSQ